MSTNSTTRAGAPILPVRGTVECGRMDRIWRRGSESNRRTRLCRPLHNHSATPPGDVSPVNRVGTMLPGIVERCSGRRNEKGKLEGFPSHARLAGARTADRAAASERDYAALTPGMQASPPCLGPLRHERVVFMPRDESFASDRPYSG